MKLSPALLLLASLTETAAFSAAPIRSANTATATATAASNTQLFGYLDNLSDDLYGEVNNPDVEAGKKENTDMAKDKVDRLGPGDWSQYVEFDEFDGGDGQMGVAGDGNNKLEKFGSDVQPQLAKSAAMSAKNAWGSTTGYAAKLIEEGKTEVVRAQQLENWMNQQEVLKKKNQHKAGIASFDTQVAEEDTSEEDWRKLSKFGVQRNQEFDLDETFGAVATAGEAVEGTIELTSRIGQNAVHEFTLKNEYMGFADFRAAFSDDTSTYDWTITPNEGSLSNREGTTFLLRFKPNGPGFSEGYLIIETEDFKKTWKLIGGTS
mmetsp:Transcript_31402/g.51832  ORF Transcript_31402/g.51832 Transcript_31402/m.51832 type:complete len:320 (+) Transcript_31402:78-1037(+)